MARMVAHYDYEAARRVARWPLVELLHAFQGLMQREAQEAYRHDVEVWATLAASGLKWKPPLKKPQLPGILRSDGDT
jgi:hypothetical protein